MWQSMQKLSVNSCSWSHLEQIDDHSTGWLDFKPIKVSRDGLRGQKRAEV
jgi:hypothetical protein